MAKKLLFTIGAHEGRKRGPETGRKGVAFHSMVSLNGVYLAIGGEDDDLKLRRLGIKPIP